MPITTTKAQIKMFETLAVLIVFFILLSIGMSIYFFLQKANFNQDLEHQRQLAALSLVQKILYLPELDCNFLQTTEDNCIEQTKLEAFKDVLSTGTAKIDYFPLFGLSTITLHQIYPELSTTILWDKQPPAIKRTFATQSPILIKNPITDKNAFGYVEIKNYVQD